MEMVRERTLEQERVVSKEEQEHNARISERYNQLKNIVEDQFAQKTPEMTVQASVYTSNAAVQTPSFGYTPAIEQRPQVTEYIRNLRQSVSDFEISQGMEVSSQQETVVQTENVAQESYSLTAFAKATIAAFAVAVVAMLAIISFNTHTIEQKNMRINELQVQKQELIERNQAIERRIEEAKSEDTIRQYAESQGMVKAEE